MFDSLRDLRDPRDVFLTMTELARLPDRHCLVGIVATNLQITAITKVFIKPLPFIVRGKRYYNTMTITKIIIIIKTQQ